jgi:hypothetical protein
MDMDLPSVFPPIHKKRKFQPGWRKVGRDVFVFWPREKKWFQGVVKYVYSDGNVLTVYPDGDETKGGDLVLPLIDVCAPASHNHFEWGACKHVRDRRFYYLSDQYPFVWEHSFVAVRGSDDSELLAYVVAFVEGQDGSITHFKGVWVYALNEVANNSFTLASVYTAEGSAEPRLSIPGLNDRPGNKLVRSTSCGHPHCLLHSFNDAFFICITGVTELRRFYSGSELHQGACVSSSAAVLS